MERTTRSHRETWDNERDQNRSYREIVSQILREAEEIDRREDELYGQARGDELPEQLRTPDAGIGR